MPDIVVCTAYGYIDNMLWQGFGEAVKGVNAPEVNVSTYNITGNKGNPCAPSHDRMTVITLKNRTVDRGMFQYYSFSILPNPLHINEQFSVIPAYVIVLPNRINPYGTDMSKWPSGFQFSRDVADNLYGIPQTRSTSWVRSTPSKTWLRRLDFMGLFGISQEMPSYTVSTSITTYSQLLSTSRVLVIVPSTNIEQSQLLITTIQSALSSWGGAFSLVWSVYYAFFGTPRMDPFGWVIIYLFAKTTKRKVIEYYNSQDGGFLDKEADSMKVLPTSQRPRSYNLNRGSIQSWCEGEETPEMEKDRRLYEVEFKTKRLEAILNDYYLNLEMFKTDEPEKKQNVPLYRKLFGRRKGKVGFEDHNNNEDADSIADTIQSEQIHVPSFENQPGASYYYR
ncbi:hypothetical protein BGX28_000906 [Mortierella sp. GBA30]|nr:hypothetical protein BGX28_000906 [Mortierella sp. GBA30]